jgi:hypothetical protein
MAPGSGGRSRAGAFQLPVCRRIVPTQRWGRNICRFAHERGSVAVTTCVSAHQPAPVSFRNQSPHADRPFRMAPCVGDFPWSSDRQSRRGDGDANIFLRYQGWRSVPIAGTRWRHCPRAMVGGSDQRGSAAKRLRVLPCLRCKLKSQPMADSTWRRTRYPVEWAISIVFAGFASTAREG